MIIKRTSISSKEILSDLVEHTTRVGDCLEWNGCLNTDGYPRIAYKGNLNTKVHRLAAELHYGEVITGRVVRHTCDNTKCINPLHLLLGTVKDNMQDRGDRNRTYRVMTVDKIQKIKALLESKVLTQSQIADIVGVDYRRVSDVHRNRYSEDGSFSRYGNAS